ncbi:MAG: class I SAM-dependent methyltransferase [Planctomycetaceae bacterium]
MDTPSDAIRCYSDLASEYDAVRFTGRSGRFVFETDKAIINRLIEQTGAKRIVDVPVGTGRVLQYLRGRDLDVTGVDVTDEMLAESKKVADPQRHHLLKGNAAELPFEDGEFDCLISLRFFHLFEPAERRVFAEEFLRVVRPGGFLIVSFTNGWYGGGINWLRRLFGRKTVQFEHPGELRRLFPDCVVERRVGNFLPKQSIMDRVPLLGASLRRLTNVVPLNLICWERIYLLRKKGDLNG